MKARSQPLMRSGSHPLICLRSGPVKRDGSMGLMLLTRLYGKRWEGEENLHLILHQHYQIAANKHRALECETNDSAPARLPLYETSISWKKNKTSKLQFYQPRQSEQFTVKLKITITVKPKMKSALSLSCSATVS